MTGLGDRLICLAAAWLYARTTGRTLVIDWRFGHLSRDRRTNAFAICFQNSSHLAGVPIVGDDRVTRLKLPVPRFPFIWNNPALLERPMRRPNDLIELDRRAAVSLIHDNRDRPEPVVVFDTCINDGLVRLEDAREFFQALEPIQPVGEAIAEFQRQKFQNGPVVGLHIRHGNGGDTMGHARHWVSFDDAIARCLRCVGLARERLGQEAPVFLCTDSSEVEAAVTAQVPDVFTRPKRFRQPGAGELHRAGGAWAGRNDALVEMFLLGRTQALIRYPPGSFFSLYGAVMKQRIEAPPATLHELLSPSDECDPLSPALIL